MVPMDGENLTQRGFILDIKPPGCADGLDVRVGEGKVLRIMPDIFI